MVVDNAAADQAACRSGGVLLQKSDPGVVIHVAQVG
jgi:hypothetical protein